MPAGFLNLLKPPGMTSHDVVSLVRRRLPRKTKVGHLGTLDPPATGVLPLAVGSATRLIPLLPDLGPRMKSYHALIQLGLTTSTDDTEGEVLGRAGTEGVTEDRLAELMETFQGEIEQVPPQVSAIRKGGERAYEKVRRGETVELESRPVVVDRCRLLDYSPATSRLRLSLVCSSGTYVRSVARDLGQILGTGGALAFLIRTHSGPFQLETAVTLEELLSGPVEQHLLPSDFPFQELPLVKGLEVTQKGEVVKGDFPALPHFRAKRGLLTPTGEPGEARVVGLFEEVD